MTMDRDRGASLSPDGRIHSLSIAGHTMTEEDMGESLEHGGETKECRGVRKPGGWVENGSSLDRTGSFLFPPHGVCHTA